jgi:rod shape-determining protein MreB
MVEETSEVKAEQTEKTEKTVTKSDVDILYVGLDLGTSQSAIATSSGVLLNTASVVGWPKDLISYKLHKKAVLFGDECLKNRMSVDMYFPFEKGVIPKKASGSIEDGTPGKKSEAPGEFIKHMISLANPKPNQKVYVVVGTPAEATGNDKKAIVDAVGGLADSVLVVSQPFLVAYGLGVYGFSLIVDIGAGTLDICRMHGTMPNDSDQKTSFKAGNYIDEMLLDMLRAKFPNGQITPAMAKQFKEQYAFAGDKHEQISIEILIKGKPTRCDITNEIKASCESIIPDIISTLKRLVVSFDPEFQEALRNNILLAGCVSRMAGLDQEIIKGLSELGGANVSVVEDPVFAGAMGALNLGKDMPKEEWQAM